MGWDFTQGASKSDVVREICREQRTGLRTLARCLRGNTLWTVHEYVRDGEPHRFIGCYLLGAEKGFGWGSKAMDESMHPYQYTCPIAYLEMVPVVACAAWRDKVRALAAQKSMKVKVGDVVKLKNCTIATMRVVEIIRRTIIGADETGRRYRVSRRYLAAVVTSA